MKNVEDKTDGKYAPKIRDIMKPTKEELNSYSKEAGTYTKLPDPVEDPIVCNNISYAEFDYITPTNTEDL
ncbi:hypothetical protein [Inconstantimicrobium mannanitabidum]|uniref:Uncharacterized protein n=1 Tax=Inconstantimicrobium mannanitabidum TaxID=1604901 RepID=A0ACB5RFI9_9CLOT|nr:hypothetical protein [Clostridium sp. TW13]GKX67849.1 hypothetical protein rsdtw13_31070 [Clostridium sp. TW13]